MWRRDKSQMRDDPETGIRSGMLRAVLAGLFAIVCTAAAGSIGAGPAQAETRIALVIGNANYTQYGVLPNSAGDATAIASALREVGFDVTELHDQRKEDLGGALNAFASRAGTANVSLIYYAGHGVELSGHNYLIPTDAVLTSDADVRYRATPLDDVMAAVEGTKGLGIVIIDACRDNPFLKAMRQGGAHRGLGQGLSDVDAPDGILVAFSAAQGKVAIDSGGGAHSPYAEALLRHIPEPGVDIVQVLGRVRADVLKATADQQSPRLFYAANGQPFYFVPPRSVASTLPALPAATTSVTVDKSYQESQYWEAIKASTDPEDYRQFLAKFPEGTFAGLARNRLRALLAASPVVVAASTPPQVATAAPTDGPAPPAANPAAPIAPPQASEPKPVEVATLTGPPPPGGASGPLARPPMIAFDMPTLPQSFCSQVDMSGYLTDVHRPLDRAAKANNQTAIDHFGQLTELFKRLRDSKPGSAEFLEVDHELDAYEREARLRFDIARKVNALDGDIRNVAIRGGANCGHLPWANPVKAAPTGPTTGGA